MTRLMLMAVLGLLAACGGPPPPVAPAAVAAAGISAADQHSALRFLAAVYARYHPDDTAEAMAAPAAATIYSAAMVAALQGNQDAYAGEVGYLDNDPLCDCQDLAQDLRHLRFQLQPLADGRLLASSRFDDPVQPLQLRLTLQRQGDSWRIDDIATPHAASLRQALERDTAALQRAPAP